MSGRSANSVRELLGKFEENNQHVSPPSRGRSPAGSESVTSTDSRRYSKVRTSFVSVERSGQMAPSLRKLSSNFDGNMGGDGQLDHEPVVNGRGPEKAMANGGGVSPKPSNDAIGSSTKGTNEDTVGAAKEEGSNMAAKALDKLISADEHETAASSQADSKDDKAMAERGAVLERRTSLGDLLKGHAFEQEASAEPGTSASEPPKAQEPANSNSNQLQSRTLSTDLKEKVGKPTGMNTPGRKSPTNTRHPSTRPSPIATTKDSLKAPSTSATAPIATTSKSPTTPKTPRDGGLPIESPVSKAVSPRQTLSVKPSSKAPVHERKQAPTQKPVRSSAVPKPPTATTSKPSQASGLTNTSLARKTGPTSPPMKTHSKSPTRPVRLPASLTAPTAASVAKLGGAAPARPSSRTSHTTANKPSTLTKGRIPAVTSQSHPKPPRASLPASSAVPPKPKVRTSIASSKPADGGFLARMMRPTQSSASKTHDKVEPKTPPKKTISAKSKEANEGRVEHGAQENGEGDPKPPQDALEASHVSNLEAERDPINEASNLHGERSSIDKSVAAPSEAVSA